MEELIDSLSKRLASVSRRDMLRITSRMLLGAFVAATGLDRVWAATPATPAPPGGSQCGAVQQALQVGIGDYAQSTFGTREQWLSLLTGAAGKATGARLITKTCSACIVDQFRDNVLIAQQTSCGTIVPPGIACTTDSASSEKVAAASTLALATAPNAMSDGASFAALLELTQNILNCQLNSSVADAEPKSLTEPNAEAALCAAAGVNYCGPGNSGDPSNFWGQFLLSVPNCLNEQCCIHDNCYSKVCLPFSCYFVSSTTSSCDAPLIAACNGTEKCSLLALLSPSLQFVCSVVSCLTQLTTDANCLFIQAARYANAQCNGGPCTGSSCCSADTTCVTADTVVPGALTGVCCPSGDTACEAICCPPKYVCTEGQCVCATGRGSLCGAVCCELGQVCQNGSCVATAGGLYLNRYGATVSGSVISEDPQVEQQYLDGDVYGSGTLTSSTSGAASVVGANASSVESVFGNSMILTAQTNTPYDPDSELGFAGAIASGTMWDTVSFVGATQGMIGQLILTGSSYATGVFCGGSVEIFAYNANVAGALVSEIGSGSPATTSVSIPLDMPLQIVGVANINSSSNASGTPGYSPNNITYVATWAFSLPAGVSVSSASGTVYPT